MSHKSPEARPLVNKNGSISYAILPRREINASDLKLTKKMKSPSPQVKLGHDQQQIVSRLRSPNVESQKGAKNNYSSVPVQQ